MSPMLAWLLWNSFRTRCRRAGTGIRVGSHRNVARIVIDTGFLLNDDEAASGAGDALLMHLFTPDQAQTLQRESALPPTGQSLGIKRLCESSHCKLLTTVIPTKMEYDGTLKEPQYQAGLIADYIEEIAAENNVTFLNLGPSKQRSQSIKTFYLKRLSFKSVRPRVFDQAATPFLPGESVTALSIRPATKP